MYSARLIVTLHSFFTNHIMYKPSFNKRSVLKFTHFTRKGYALFACLGREVIIGVLSAATLQHATASGISIDTEKITTDSTLSQRLIELEEVSVTGTRAPLTERQQARMVTVLSRQEIQAAPVQSVNDLLKQFVGVDVRQRGAIGAQTDVSIRGSNYEQIAILLNGINIGDPQTGHNVFSLPVDISDIERIEVLEGPAGRIYGTSSLLGAINIVTKGASSTVPIQKDSGTNNFYEDYKQKKFNVETRLEGGSYGYLNVGGRASLLSQSISASFTRSDGYSRSKAGNLNADYKGWKAFYEGSHKGTWMKAHWHAGVAVKDFGSNTFYGAQWDEQFEHVLKTYMAVQAENTQGAVHLRPSVYWNHTQDRFELFRDAPEKYPFNYHRSNVYGMNLNSWFDWTLGRTAIGAEVRAEELVSTNLGEPLDKPKHIHGTNREYAYGLNRTNLSFTLEHNILLERFTLSAGFTAVHNNWADIDLRLYPGMDMSYWISDRMKVFASYNSSLRMPSATELYYSVGGHKADKHLKPEEVNAWETGISYQTTALRAKVCMFYNHHKNLIDWTRHTDEGEDAPWQSMNFGRINNLGIEGSAEVNLHDVIPSQKFLRTLSVSYCYQNQHHKSVANIQSRYALEYLRHKLTSRLSCAIARNLLLDISYRWQDRDGAYTNTDGKVVRYASYGVLDAKMKWTQPHYEIYVEGNNLLDKSYVDYGNVPQPGIWVIGGVSVRF